MDVRRRVHFLLRVAQLRTKAAVKVEAKAKAERKILLAHGLRRFDAGERRRRAASGGDNGKATGAPDADTHAL